MLHKAGSSVILVAILLLTVYTIKSFDAPNEGLDQTGFRLVCYHLARLSLIFSIALCALTLGAAIIWRLVPTATCTSVGTACYVACTGFTGSIAISLLMILLGTCRCLDATIAVVMAAGLLALAPWFLNQLAANVRQKLLAMVTRKKSRIYQFFLGGMLTVVVLAFLVMANVKALNPETIDGDVWEHYLHYYKAVLDNHGLAPNELWYHFYLSKGAGLFFFSMLLSDVFGSPLASACLVLFAAVVVYDLVSRATRQDLWAVMACVLFLIYLAMPLEFISSFHKHHVPLACLYCMTVAAVARGQTARRPAVQRLLCFTGCLTGFYITIYLPPFAPILLMSLVGIAISTRLSRTANVRISFVPAVALASLMGAVSMLTINYVATGLAEFAPAAFFWKHSDPQRFSQIWSKECVEFFFTESEPIGKARLSLGSFLKWDYVWTKKLCRFSFLNAILGAKMACIMAALLACSLVASKGDGVFRYRKIFLHLARIAPSLVLLSGAILGAVAFAQVMPDGGSLKRLFVFCGILTILAAVLALSTLSAIVPFDRSIFCFLLPTAITMAFVWQLVSYLSPVPFEYGMGRISLRGAFALCVESSDSVRTLDLYAAARERVPLNDRILALNYEPTEKDAGARRFMPFPPLVGEVSYAFGNSYPVILFGSPEEAERKLKELRINYFVLNLERNLFCGIPHTALFQSDQIEKHFSLAWHQDDVYLLTWKQPHLPTIPVRALRVLDLMQHGRNHDWFRDGTSFAIKGPTGLTRPENVDLMNRIAHRIDEDTRSASDGAAPDSHVKGAPLTLHRLKVALHTELTEDFGIDLANRLVLILAAERTRLNPMTDDLGVLLRKQRDRHLNLDR